MSEQSDTIDIARAAYGMFRKHGNEAEFECAERIKYWEKRGDSQSAALWRSVLELVRDKRRAD